MTKIYFETHGCSANLAESEMMMGIAHSHGNEITQEENTAEVLVINICTVKGDTKALRQIRRLKLRHPTKKIIVAGCIPKHTVQKIKEISNEINLINTHNLTSINEVVQSSLKNKSHDAINYKSNDNTISELPRLRTNPIIGIIPVSTGCTSSCTFCSVKQIKGNLKSIPTEFIIKNIISSLKDGAREIWLTSQDNGCYGFDIGTNLVGEIIKMEYNFKVRIGMASPHHLTGYLDKLLEIIISEKIFRFIHLPVQSGNNSVLRDMKRDYTIETYTETINKLKMAFPDITISTDIICGFPTETEEQFNDTLRLIELLKFDIINISGYKARPNTISSRMPQLSGKEIKNRTRKITKLFNVVALQQNRKWYGWTGSIVIDEIGKNNTFIGRNYAYKPVVVQGKFNLGEEITVKIVDSTNYDLRGEVI